MGYRRLSRPLREMRCAAVMTSMKLLVRENGPPCVLWSQIICFLGKSLFLSCTLWSLKLCFYLKVLFAYEGDYYNSNRLSPKAFPCRRLNPPYLRNTLSRLSFFTMRSCWSRRP